MAAKRSSRSPRFLAKEMIVSFSEYSQRVLCCKIRIPRLVYRRRELVGLSSAIRLVSGPCAVQSPLFSLC